MAQGAKLCVESSPMADYLYAAGLPLKNELMGPGSTSVPEDSV
jgi:hypothetical protein